MRGNNTIIYLFMISREKPEETIKNEQSRDTGNICHKRQNSKQNTQHRQLNRRRLTTLKYGSDPRCSRRVSSSSFIKDTFLSVTLIVKSGNYPVGYR